MKNIFEKQAQSAHLQVL